ncbi:MAG TPA: S53 family peptidase [Candidatus Limnocylindrales bacterium]
MRVPFRRSAVLARAPGVSRRWGSVVAAVILAATSAAPAIALEAPGGFLQPAVSDAVRVSADAAPPTEAQCFAVGRRCFAPQAIYAAYNLAPLYDRGLNGRGKTIAIVDSFGSDTIAHDLHVFDQAFGVQAMCGEEGVTCTSGMPWFKVTSFQGSPGTFAPPPTSKSPGQEAHNGWSLEVSLDVEWAHSIAPEANILLVTVPTAETLGVQGFPLMMNAEQALVDRGMANVISQSFASAEEAFGSTQSLLNLRHAFIAAAQHGVTVLGSSGDGGTANGMKQPVGQGGSVIPYPTVEWPASDPLVTGVGGTYLCTDPTATSGRTVDSTDPPSRCRANPGVAEVGWIASGGGYSHVFAKPSYQDTLPAGSTPIGAMRGVPDVAYEASATTGVLVYDSLDGGWFVVGGTSVSCPNWAGLVAIADQLNGGGLGLINPALYKIGANPAMYAADFFDVTTGNNHIDPSIAGYSATTGWDPVTGLGTPNAANLIPDLVAAAH